MTEGADIVGGVTTGGLIAREIGRAHADLPAVGHDPDEPCANCRAVRQGPFCHACGQAGHVHRNLGALVHDLAHGVFHFEGKIWNTLPLLAWYPGELTRRYVMGERAKFVSPMALFLFSVFLLFAIVPNLGHGGSGHAGRGASSLAGEQASIAARIEALRTVRATVPGEAARLRVDAKLKAAEAELAALDHKPAAPPPTHGAPVIEDHKGELKEAAGKIDTGIPFFDFAVRHAAENPSLTVYKLKTYAYKYSWALIPISVPFIWLLFAFRRDVGGYDHAIFAIYSLSFMSLGVVVLALLSWVGLPAGFIVLAVLLLPPIHMYRQLKGAYRLGRWGAGWRTAALLVITAITSALFFAFLVYMGNG